MFEFEPSFIRITYAGVVETEQVSVARGKCADLADLNPGYEKGEAVEMSDADVSIYLQNRYPLWLSLT